jgi:hypothetical protein
VDAVGADIPYVGSKVIRELALDVEVPLHDVVSFRLLVNPGNGQRLRHELRESSLIKRTRREFGGGGQEVGRSRAGLHVLEFVRQRQHVVESETRVKGGLPVIRTPDKADSRLEVQQSWVAEERVARWFSGLVKLSKVEIIPSVSDNTLVIS